MSTPTVSRREMRIPVGAGAVSGVLSIASRPRALSFILGHGAGGTLHTPLLAAVAHGLADRGYSTLRYNFPYSEAGRRRPDFPRTLQATVRAAAGALRDADTGGGIVLAGKSLGGRMASHVAADGDLDVAGLAFLGYPLHPQRKPTELRDAHLPLIRAPMLFVQGTRDAFADLALLRGTLDRLSASGSSIRLHVVEGGDHSYGVPAALGRTRDDVVAEVVGAVASWADELA